MRVSSHFEMSGCLCHTPALLEMRPVMHGRRLADVISGVIGLLESCVLRQYQILTSSAWLSRLYELYISQLYDYIHQDIAI